MITREVTTRECANTPAFFCAQMLKCYDASNKLNSVHSTYDALERPLNSTITAEFADGITFDVFDVERAEEPLPTVHGRVAAEALVGTEVEACSHYSNTFCTQVSTNPLVTAVTWAHAQHRPLVLSPDIIWLAILQGLSIHLETHWDEWKDSIATSKHDQRVVRVSTTEFPNGSAESAWGELITEATSFAYGAVEESVADLFGASFSTTRPANRVAMDLAFLSAMNSYISLQDTLYVCGIPQITVRGNIDDWRWIRDQVETIERFGLSWWTEFLRPIVDQFVALFQGAKNLEFWKQIYTAHEDYCGGDDRVDGWISHLFPYLSIRESGVDKSTLLRGGEPPQLDHFPNGLREVPLQVDDDERMRLVGGSIGISQDDDLNLAPQSGWAVIRETSG